MVSEEGPVRAVGRASLKGPVGQSCDYYSKHLEEPLEGFQPGREHREVICDCSLENGLNLERPNLNHVNQSVLLVARLTWRPTGVGVGNK